MTSIKQITLGEQERINKFLEIVNNGMIDGRIRNINLVFNRVLFNFLSIDTAYNEQEIINLLLNANLIWSEHTYIRMFLA